MTTETARAAAEQAIETGRLNCPDCGDLLVKGAFQSILAALQAHRALICKPTDGAQDGPRS